jgi:O-antigen biosynthesis protein
MRGLGTQELRAAILDRLVPMSVPFSQYQLWRERFPILPGGRTALQGGIVMVGPGAQEDTLESLHDQTHTDWVGMSLPCVSDPVGFESDLIREFLGGEGARCEFTVFVLSGAILAATALQRIAAAFSACEAAVAVYGDLDVHGVDGSLWPLAFPAFDYERMLEQGYCAHLFALRRSAADRLLAGGPENLYRLFNSIFDNDSLSSREIVHLPGALGVLPVLDTGALSETLAVASQAHLEKRGVRASVVTSLGDVLPSVRVARVPDDLGATIVIPTRNQRPLLQACIESIRPAVQKLRAEIIVVDNDSADPDTLGYLREIEGTVATILRVRGHFNFPRLNNCAARVAKSEVLCLLNNDTVALDADWLEEMLGRIAEEDVGAVGALLRWPSGVVQHGGVVLGPGFSALHAFDDRIESDAGYGDLLRVAHECSAVTAACLVTRRRDYLRVCGMDEMLFPLNFNDVDYCLKLRALGKRVVFTPHARLVHLESQSRGGDRSSDRRARFERELQNLRGRWGNVLASDPYYSPVLSLDLRPFSALAWPPRGFDPRVNDLPSPIAIPAGF